MSKIIVRNSITRHLRAALLSSVLLLATGGLAAADGNIYRVGANDVLQVTVYGQPALTGLYPVDVDGNIGYPVVGNISVQGLTTLQISEKIASSLSQHIPGLTVTATINQYAPVFVMGDVKAPASMNFAPAWWRLN
ncbi:polysaccharide export protein [Brucella inopinata]|nr:polysaccharide export protein [Brucella inopinata]